MIEECGEGSLSGPLHSPEDHAVGAGGDGQDGPAARAECGAAEHERVHLQGGRRLPPGLPGPAGHGADEERVRAGGPGAVPVPVPGDRDGARLRRH